ncbi:MAG: PAS domain-containing protein [Lachnospiraceae bacterium]|nr:PAS domain-containing protein [Lachnospiraceae bacterium]
MIDLNEVYKSVLEADKAAVVICDLDHKIIYMNPASISRYEKWGGKGLMGKNLLDCHNEKSREMINEGKHGHTHSVEELEIALGHRGTIKKMIS